MEEIADLLARILLETANVYKLTPESDKRRLTCLLDIVDEGCRQNCNLIDVKQISRNARERIKVMKFDPVKLHRLNWDDQSRIDSGPKKDSIFCYEHPYSIRPFCLDATKLWPLDIHTAKEHVKKLKVVWILRAEDKKTD